MSSHSSQESVFCFYTEQCYFLFCFDLAIIECQLFMDDLFNIRLSLENGDLPYTPPPSSEYDSSERSSDVSSFICALNPSFTSSDVSSIVFAYNPSTASSDTLLIVVPRNTPASSPASSLYSCESSTSHFDPMKTIGKYE
jgi:hypothetical protein